MGPVPSIFPLKFSWYGSHCPYNLPRKQSALASRSTLQQNLPMDDLSFIKGESPRNDPFFAEEDRPLCAADLLTASAPGTAGIKRLRDSHHQIAALLASGMAAREVAAATGYSENRIALLKGDPAFKGLLEFYRGKNREQLERVIDRVKVLGLDALAELQERLETNAEDFTNADLMRLLGLTLDRAGFGPTKKLEVRSGLTPEEIAVLKAATVGRERIIDAQTTDAQWSEDRPGNSGRDVLGGSGVRSLPKPGSEGEGESVRAEVGEGAEEAA